MGTISADVIILGFIAGFILYKLFSILGQRDDDSFPDNKVKTPANIIDISDRVQNTTEENTIISDEEKKLTAGFENVVNKIKEIDPKFSLVKFFNGSKKAFEIILNAFAENDRKTLQNLLDAKTYSQFIKEIDSRIQNGVQLNLTLVALPVVEIKNIQLEKMKVSIDVFYQSQQITLLKNQNGEIIEGDASQVDNVNDTWTFSKELNSKNNWCLTKVSAS